MKMEIEGTSGTLIFNYKSLRHKSAHLSFSIHNSEKSNLSLIFTFPSNPSPRRVGGQMPDSEWNGQGSISWRSIWHPGGKCISKRGFFEYFRFPSVLITPPSLYNHISTVYRRGSIISTTVSVVKQKTPLAHLKIFYRSCQAVITSHSVLLAPFSSI